MAILRIALTDGGGKWLPGTILAKHPDDFQFNWGDEARFLLLKVQDDSVTDVDAENRKKVIDLDVVLTSSEKASYQSNRSIKTEAKYKTDGKKPRLANPTDLSPQGSLVDAPEGQWSEDSVL